MIKSLWAMKSDACLEVSSGNHSNGDMQIDKTTSEVLDPGVDYTRKF